MIQRTVMRQLRDYVRERINEELDRRLLQDPVGSVVGFDGDNNPLISLDSELVDAPYTMVDKTVSPVLELGDRVLLRKAGDRYLVANVWPPT